LPIVHIFPCTLYSWVLMAFSPGQVIHSSAEPQRFKKWMATAGSAVVVVKIQAYTNLGGDKPLMWLIAATMYFRCLYATMARLFSTGADVRQAIRATNLGWERPQMFGNHSLGRIHPWIRLNHGWTCRLSWIRRPRGSRAGKRSTNPRWILKECKTFPVHKTMDRILWARPWIIVLYSPPPKWYTVYACSLCLQCSCHIVTCFWRQAFLSSISSE
jgi:hypothetical protein